METRLLIPPTVQTHDGIRVGRDDLFPGGTKARFVPELFATADEVVYASPAEGGAQTAIAHVAAALGKRATIVVAKPLERHTAARWAAPPGGTTAEVWCAAGSGVLMRALAAAWPRARRVAVQVGKRLKPADVAGAEIVVHPLPFGRGCRASVPFPADPHYDAKAWELCRARRGAGRVLFWNVAGPAMR